MSRRLFACIAAVALAFPAVAEDAAVARIKKLMPASQLEAVSAVEKILELDKKLNKETNAIRRKEFQDDIEKQAKAVIDSISKTIREDGLTDWVGAIDPTNSVVVVVGVPGLFRVSIHHDFLTPEQTKLIGAMKTGERVKFSCKAAPGFERDPQISFSSGLEIRPNGIPSKEAGREMAFSKLERIETKKPK